MRIRSSSPEERGSSGETRATTVPHAPADAADGGDQASFNGLPYFDYDPAFRVLADVEPAEPVQRDSHVR